jgi:Polyketide cyclase / dehydrase and lipid transport
MNLLECEATFEATPAAVWQVWTDVASWPEWDVSKDIARLDGEFEVGTPGWAKQRGNLGGVFMITLIEPGKRFVTECPLPVGAGKVIFDHRIEALDRRRVRVIKSVEVQGGFAPLFRLVVAPKMRRDIAESLAAMERRVRSRYPGSASPVS